MGLCLNMNYILEGELVRKIEGEREEMWEWGKGKKRRKFRQLIVKKSEHHQEKENEEKKE